MLHYIATLATHICVASVAFSSCGPTRKGERILAKEQKSFALLVKGERGVIHYCKRASKDSKTK